MKWFDDIDGVWNVCRWRRAVRGASARAGRLMACGLACLAMVAAVTQSRSTAAANGADMPDLQRTGDAVFVPPGSPYRERLVVAEVERRNIVRTLALPAQVEANPARVYNILPPLGGRVLELKVSLGDRVRKDQPLVTIVSSDLAQARADVEKAKAQVAFTRKAADRARGLIKAGGGPVKDYDSALNDAAQAGSELQRAQTRLTTVSGPASDEAARGYVVASPADGVVTNIATATGAYINDPTQAMLTVTNLDEVWVTANVPEIDTSFVDKGQSADIVFIAYPDATFRGVVQFVAAVMEPDTRRTKARIVLPNADGRLKPNMFATAAFKAPARPSLLVPNGALLMNNEATSVFIETAPWTFARRSVVPDYDEGGKSVVSRGLSAHDRVVVRGGVLLND